MESTIKLTGLWKQKDKNGQIYLSGTLSPISKVLVMPNTFKKEDREPDYYFYLGVNEKRGEKSAPKVSNDL